MRVAIPSSGIFEGLAHLDKSKTTASPRKISKIKYLPEYPCIALQIQSNEIQENSQSIERNFHPDRTNQPNMI